MVASESYCGGVGSYGAEIALQRTKRQELLPIAGRPPAHFSSADLPISQRIATKRYKAGPKR